MPDSIFQIAERAGVGLRRRIAKPFDNEFVLDLIAMRKDGQFVAVYIDADQVRVKTTEHDADDPPSKISRIQAQKLIDEWKLSRRKPPASLGRARASTSRQQTD